MKDASGFPTLLESFFTKRLIAQRRASPHTIGAYRDTFRLQAVAVCRETIGQSAISAGAGGFERTVFGSLPADELESTRANGARSRNLRLTAIRSFFRYAALEAPQHSGLIQRVLAIPNKRQPRPLVGFLTRSEIDALLLARTEIRGWVGEIMRSY